jgi:co-chaperonin GroES (HSP10)
MSKNVRLDLTENEKFAREMSGLESTAQHFAMGQDLDTLIAKEKANKFNDQVGEYMEKIDKHAELLKQYTESIKENMNSVEIKPMLTRVLIKPFEINPFQQIKVSNSGLIIDSGGLAPEAFSNDSGKWEEQQQAIAVGTVYDVGPDCKYVKEGDAVFYQRAAMVPVPFFKQGLVTVSESQIIAVVNEGLTERFKNV